MEPFVVLTLGVIIGLVLVVCWDISREKKTENSLVSILNLMNRRLERMEKQLERMEKRQIGKRPKKLPAGITSGIS